MVHQRLSLYLGSAFLCADSILRLVLSSLWQDDCQQLWEDLSPMEQGSLLLGHQCGPWDEFWLGHMTIPWMNL